MIGTPVAMLPQRAEILLMQAHSILDGFHIASHVDHRRVEVMDRANAIASELEAVGHPADAVFAHVECILFAMRPSGIAICQVHLGQRRPIQKWTYTALILIGELMKNEPFP